MLTDLPYPQDPPQVELPRAPKHLYAIRPMAQITDTSLLLLEDPNISQRRGKVRFALNGSEIPCNGSVHHEIQPC